MAQVVRLAVRQLVEFLLQSGSIDSRFTGFDRANEGARIHRRLQKAAGEGYAAEVFLTRDFTVEAGGDPVHYTVEGRADGIFTDADGITVIDEIKTTAVPGERITEDMNPCHWAQGMVYALLYGRREGLETLRVRLTYFQIDDEQTFYFVRTFSLAALEAFTLDLLTQYAPWARRAESWAGARAAGLTALSFPFEGYRPGQRALAGEVYRACRDGADGIAKGRVFCQAPTGIGKTMSTLFPALRAMGEGCGDKVFYLTACTTTRAAPEQAAALLHARHPGLALRSITLTAKDKICLCKNGAGRPECTPDACPYASGYYDRVRTALADTLDGTPALTRDTLVAAAEKHRVCPFELGLDVSLWADLIVCDYNYLFDPSAALHRFFDAPGNWLFLIDEAHNLPDRARDMYSARLTKGAVLDARQALGKANCRAKGALSQANDLLLAYRRLAERGGAAAGETEGEAPGAPADSEAAPAARRKPRKKAAHSFTREELLDGQEILMAKPGMLFLRGLPAPLAGLAARLPAPLELWLEEHREGPAHEQILQLYFDLRAFGRIAEGYDEHYVTQLSAHGADLTVSLLCLDPSAFVSKRLAGGRAAALFSATLTPPSYYKSILGCPDSRAVALQSPFPPENLGLYCACDVSTRYKDREQSLARIADYLAALVQGCTGNYLAFFPSYTYLKQVYDVFAEKYPGVDTLVQESGLDDDARAAFLARFAPAPEKTLLGFGVLGGVFGEGVDLAGDRLVGCAVVGVGLPQVNPRQEMLRRYFDEKSGCGFDYAYRYPGMNKVLQAAGRVIRTPEDRGIVLLIDDRFASPAYRALMPPHWAHLRLCRSPGQLAPLAAEFWGAAGPSRPHPASKKLSSFHY